ncbi:LysR family transcriptional regulator [uncultured Shewanella sp.]|uniref:LysR family transcriptional regulator n=1 Tax=uncultured Shewanella sp. TaxID=173975 RepID=UPI002619F996|nr:LysR family transcriptional regulator [uncultured Shewanella sp.]
MDRAKSTLEQWRILQAVVDFGGYAQAAEQLNKSQSSLNHAVGKLQQQLGVALLEVQGRKAQLTPNGEVLLRHSRTITQSVNHLENLASNLQQGWEPELTIAREIIYPMDSLIGALDAFLPQSQGTRVTILDSVITGTKEHINNQSVDIAISGGTPPKGYLAEPLCDIFFLLVCHPSHPLAARENIENDKILTQHLQIVIKDTARHETSDLGWLKAEQRWTVSNFHEAIKILKKGIGFCWIPSHLIASELTSGELSQLIIKGNTQRKAMLSLVIPNRDLQGPASKLLESLILKQHQ